MAFCGVLDSISRINLLCDGIEYIGVARQREAKRATRTILQAGLDQLDKLGGDLLKKVGRVGLVCDSMRDAMVLVFRAGQNTH